MDSLEKLMSELTAQYDLTRQNLTTPTVTPDLIQQFTNPAIVLTGQGNYIQNNIETAKKNAQISHFGSTRTAHTGHHSLPTNCKTTANLEFDPLNRVEISDLAKNPNKVLWGKYLLCQTLSPASMVVGIQVVVSDPRGTEAVRLALYNYSGLTGGKTVLQVDFDELLPPGMFLILRNPWFKSTGDGGLTLRCDNPSEVILLGEKRVQELFKDLTWNTSTQRLTGMYFQKGHFWQRLPNRNQQFQMTKWLGNKAFSDKRTTDAVRFYDLCLEICEDKDKGIILSNKVAALLGMECYNSALQLSDALLSLDPTNEKIIDRKTKALLGLARYDEGFQFLQQKTAEIQQLLVNKDLKSLLETAKFLLSRKNLGPTASQWGSLFAKDFTDFVNLPEFIGPITISKMDGKGRGIIATKDIAVGQLILCSKSFACHETPATTNMYTSLNLTQNVFRTKPGHDQVVGQIANKIFFDPELGTGFYNLSGGRELGHLTPGDWRIGQVDIKRIDEIVRINAFGTDELERANYTGLWVFPSYFNHSCSEANCVVEIYKTAMIIRTIKPVKKGEELMLPYISPTKSYEERKQWFEGHDFLCTCRLCKFEAKESASVSERRKVILEQLEGKEMLTPDKLMPSLELIKELYILRKKAPELNYCLLSNQVFGVAEALFTFGRWNDCIYLLQLMFKVAEKSILWYDFGVKIATNMIRCYIAKGDEEMILVWVKKVKDLLLNFHGSLEPMKSIGPKTMEELKNGFGIDFLA